MDVSKKTSNEKRLIDADALVKAIRTDYFEHFTQYHDTDQIALIDMVCDDIEESHTVDTVPVVRCQDCFNYTPVNDKIGKCVFLIGEHQYVMPDGYCYLGERKEGAENG